MIFMEVTPPAGPLLLQAQQDFSLTSGWTMLVNRHAQHSYLVSQRATPGSISIFHFFKGLAEIREWHQRSSFTTVGIKPHATSSSE
jgi:hypothetical protein